MKTSNRKLHRIAIPLSLLAALAATIMAQNEAPPDKTFKTSHLLNLPADMAEGAVLSVLGDMNQAIAKAGCATCRYALFKVYGPQQGTYSYMWEAAWPSGAVYTKHCPGLYPSVPSKSQIRYPRGGDMQIQV